MSADDLIAVAVAIQELGAGVSTGDIGVYAIERGVHNWAVFPGSGKIPANPAHPESSRERQTVQGRVRTCGSRCLRRHERRRRRGQWWGGPYIGANILGRVPAAMFVLDIDPRNRGDRIHWRARTTHGHCRRPWRPSPDAATVVLTCSTAAHPESSQPSAWGQASTSRRPAGM